MKLTEMVNGEHHPLGAGAIDYARAMAQSPRVTGFGAYLKEAILAARFPTPTHFARAVGTDPSVVLRWISEEQRPTIRSIERISSILGKSMNEMVLAAYPDRLGLPVATVAQTHPLARELDMMLSEQSPIDVADREALASVLDRMLDPYRKLMRRRRLA